ncbi:MAG: trimethylamine methyltransferase family protein [Deltaproteobacteria bacterium]|jgi:trimethylamine--corrinoid protein Co-methyltransferase|nr:trimethylamine methyltransferase family protein [Deltaproteobacteria bacterium]
MNNVRPRLTLMTEEQIHESHANVLKLLHETGVRVDSPSILQMLETKLGSKSQDRIVKFPQEIVEEAIESAPKSIDVYDRRGEHRLKLGEDRLRFGTGVTALFYQDPADDTIDVFKRENFRNLVRLSSGMKHYDVISTLGIVRDVPAGLSDLYGSLEHISNTTKPLVLLVSDENRFSDVLEMFELLCGDLRDRPFVIPYFNPGTPLVMNAGTVDKMKLSIERGLPVIFSNYGMAGASTPLAPAGAFTLLMAELLAGLVISQTIERGAPILLGMLPVYFDMRTMLNFYDPQTVLISIACSEMMKHYGIPHCSTSGSGAGWGMDLIAADTYWMNTLPLLLSHGHLAPFIGDSHGSKSISPTTIVHVHEIIDQALRIGDGFQLDDVNSALDEIADVGPGKNFLSQPSTLKNYKDHYYTSAIYPHYIMEKWQEAGEPPAHQILREKTRDLLASAPIPDDHSDLMGRGEAFIKKYAS